VLTSRVVLSADQAATSGYCIHVGTRPLRWGIARDCFARREVLRMAQMFAVEAGQPAGFVFAYEDHATMRRIHASRAAVMSLGGALHRWLEQLDLMGHPPSLRFGVAPMVWQAAVLGCVPKDKRERRKEMSKAWASAYVGQPIVSDDVSDSVGIGAFAVLDSARLMAPKKQAYKGPRATKKVRKRQGVI
jgi:hypothetical protein